MLETLQWIFFLKRFRLPYKGGMEDPLHFPKFMDTPRLKVSESSSEEETGSLSPSIQSLEEDEYFGWSQFSLPSTEYVEAPYLHERTVGDESMRTGQIEGSLLSGTSESTVDETTLQKPSTTIPSLPEFEQLLSEGSSEPSRRSKSPKKSFKKALTPSSSVGTHPVTKRRHILPKTPTHSQSTSGSISPSSLKDILFELSEGGTGTGTGTVDISSLSTTAISGDIESDGSSADPQPGTSGTQRKRPSDIPLTFDSASATSSSEGSPSLASATEEVVKVFVYEEDEDVKRAAAASEQSQSVMPLIKEELRTKIQLKRLMSGEEEAEIEFKTPDFKMSLAEVKKRERKKEQNRQAALRSRQRQSSQEEEIIKKYKALENQRRELVKQKQVLLEAKKTFMDSLNLHVRTECQLESRDEDANTLNQLQGGSSLKE